jgi:3D (Asp-Asp-Asp) domain-containing protein
MVRKAFYLLLAFLVAVGMGYLLVPTPAGAQNTDCYHMQGGNKWVCDNGGEIELQEGAVLDIQAGATASINTMLFPVSTAQTVTQNAQITPVGTFHRLTSAASVSTADIEILDAGTVVVLVNVGSNTITISDTGTLKLSGDIALGANDTVTLLSDGTNWIQLATSNN